MVDIFSVLCWRINFKAREEGNHTAMVNQMELMKKNQAELDSYRKNLAKIEDKYINSMDYFKGE